MRKDHRNKPYYWLAGIYKMTDMKEDTDAWALDHGVTPISFDMTAYEVIPKFSTWDWRA